MLVALIFTACFTLGCDNISSTKLLDAFSESDAFELDVGRTVTITLQEKDGSGVTGTATFTEYIGSSSTILNFAVALQNAVPGRRYVAHIYSGNSCDALGSLWQTSDFPTRSFTADENGVGKSDFTTALTIGTNPETDIGGKVIVIHGGVETNDLAGGTLVSCGVITE